VERDLDVVLRHMYREVQQENTEGCVSEERLDEKDVAMMDVSVRTSVDIHSTFGSSTAVTALVAQHFHPKLDDDARDLHVSCFCTTRLAPNHDKTQAADITLRFKVCCSEGQREEGHCHANCS
jgi:hypothetical protein